MASEKYATIHYHSYLELDKILGAQSLRSEALGTPAHEEMLFIVTHQVYELWFKQMIHEIQSVVDMFDRDAVDERSIGTAVARLDRVIEIQHLLIQQIKVMETMTALDFLDFRSYLFPASGFQSFQFRLLEGLLGLKESRRLTYNQKPYDIVFSAEQQDILRGVGSKNLFELVEKWLERTPFLEFSDFNFLAYYRQAVQNMLEREQQAIKESPFLNDEEKDMRLRMSGSTDTYFQSVLDEAAHKQSVDNGQTRLSYKATVAALLITLYNDEPILHTPALLLNRLVTLDENMTTWRYRHAQMVLRMLGRKIGTGGSSGHDYLQATAAQHLIFRDFHNISTLLIPRSELPPLPAHLVQELGFYFSSTHPKNR